MKEIMLHSVKGTPVMKRIKKYFYLYLLLLLPISYYFIFKYIPMIGNIIAFRKYRLGLSIFGSEWSGLKYFKLFIGEPTFWLAFKNTLVLSVSTLIFSFPMPILFALLLNEIRNTGIKRIVQTVSYLPKFVSTVVVVAMIKELLSPQTGIINSLLENLGIAPVFFVNEPGWFRPIYIGSDIWQFMGWNSIIYIAALANIDLELYEAAVVDGANRFQQVLHVTLPGIMHTIVINLLLCIGYLLSVGFEKVLLLYTQINSSTSEVIDTFVFRIGLQNNNYSYATAINLFSGIVALILLYTANTLSRKATEISLF